MCKVCTEAADCVAFEHERYHRFGHVYVPRQSIVYSTLNASSITGLDMCQVCTEAVDCKALLNTSYIAGLGMCKVCTEAVDCVAL